MVVGAPAAEHAHKEVRITRNPRRTCSMVAFRLIDFESTSTCCRDVGTPDCCKGKATATHQSKVALAWFLDDGTVIVTSTKSGFLAGTNPIGFPVRITMAR